MEYNPVETVRLSPQPARRRLSDLRGIFSAIPSRKGLKKAIDNGLVLLDGRTAQSGDWVRGGEELTLLEKSQNGLPLELEIPVIFEDDHLAVVHKPPGIAVSGNQYRTLVRALPHNLGPSHCADALTNPQPAHRLDYPTGGLLLVGKTQSALAALSQKFAERTMEKVYIAITTGDMPPKGHISIAIDGHAAATRFERLDKRPTERYGVLTLVHLVPRTGRRHQLRKHMAALGCPILGDQRYANPEQRHPRKGLFLQAISLRFEHPVSGEELIIQGPVHKKFSRFFDVACR